MRTPRHLLVALLSFALVAIASAASFSPVRVNSGGHYLETADGKPFFSLGDTA
jgi:hypothetical protein